jgi:benzylsuccinate CoA-transferase BbsF subunit
MGAEVIKVQEVQPNRRGQEQGQRGFGAALNGYALTYEGRKLFVTLDFETDKGKEVLKRLVAVSDILIENHRTVVLERAGLDYDHLRQINPGLIMVSITYAGHTGPERNYAGFGHGIDGLAAMAFFNGYHDQTQPMRSGVAYGDCPTGLHTVGAIMAALRHRRRTGEGQYIDVSLREGVMAQLGELFMDYAINRRFFPRIGNRDPGFAPVGCYPCEGSDSWITISVRSDVQWDAFCRIMGNPAWTKDQRFSDMASRWLHHDALDEQINRWTQNKDASHLAEQLQTVGVAASPAASVIEILNASKPHQDRRFWERVSLPEVGRYKIPSAPWHLSKTPALRPTAPAAYAQHNDKVFLGILGLSEEEYRQLQEAAIVVAD